MLSRYTSERDSLEKKYEQLIEGLKEEIALLRKKLPPDVTRK
jgi:hypothetical protein